MQYSRGGYAGEAMQYSRGGTLEQWNTQGGGYIGEAMEYSRGGYIGGAMEYSRGVHWWSNGILKGGIHWWSNGILEDAPRGIYYTLHLTSPSPTYITLTWRPHTTHVTLSNLYHPHMETTYHICRHSQHSSHLPPYRPCHTSS